MFLITLTYRKPMAVIKDHMEAHMAYVKQQYAAGHFLASGRMVPRTGGLILAKVDTRAHLDKIIEQDPFYRHELVDVEIVEFTVTNTRPELAFMKAM
jgi:uncharacterized protein YciI